MRTNILHHETDRFSRATKRVKAGVFALAVFIIAGGVNLCAQDSPNKHYEKIVMSAYNTQANGILHLADLALGDNRWNGFSVFVMTVAHNTGDRCMTTIRVNTVDSADQNPLNVQTNGLLLKSSMGEGGFWFSGGNYYYATACAVDVFYNFRDDGTGGVYADYITLANYPSAIFTRLYWNTAYNPNNSSAPTPISSGGGDIAIPQGQTMVANAISYNGTIDATDPNSVARSVRDQFLGSKVFFTGVYPYNYNVAWSQQYIEDGQAPVKKTLHWAVLQDARIWVQVWGDSLLGHGAGGGFVSVNFPTNTVPVEVGAAKFPRGVLWVNTDNITHDSDGNAKLTVSVSQ
jgi:hypothetical protein